MYSEKELKKALFDEFKEQLETCGKIPVYEIEVLNLKTKEFEFVLCNIEFDEANLSIEATRQAVNTKEEKSNKIAFDSVEIDRCFNLDQHLQTLVEITTEKLINGNLFCLR